jgi:uncharacterized protein with GYD domain
MTKYVVLASYSDPAVSMMLKHPSDRAHAVKKLAEAAGGKMESLHWMFGPYDALVILDMPDASAMAAVALAVISSHALKRFETYELIPHADIPGIEDKARAVFEQYQPPGQEE